MSHRILKYFAQGIVVLLPLYMISAEEGKKPWGKEYTTERHKARITAILSKAKTGPEALLKECGDTIMVGPALWARLKKSDPTLTEHSTNSHVNMGTTKQRFEQGAFLKDQVPFLVKSPALLTLFSTFSNGTVRAASERERGIYYATISFEIEKDPITVVQKDTDVLLVDLIDNKIFWLEMLSDWHS